jgi:hypothetical protein
LKFVAFFILMTSNQSICPESLLETCPCQNILPRDPDRGFMPKNLLDSLIVGVS